MADGGYTMSVCCCILLCWVCRQAGYAVVLGFIITVALLKLLNHMMSDELTSCTACLHLCCVGNVMYTGIGGGLVDGGAEVGGAQR